MLNLFDQYELRARIAPTALLCSPLVLLILPLVELWPVGLLPAGIAVGTAGLLVYAASFLVRGIGKAREPLMWAKWGGAPSTVVMQGDDATFSDDVKRMIREAVARRFDISLHAGTASDPAAVADTFSLVKQRIRQLDPNGLWAKHDAEYGFLRNLLAALPTFGAGVAGFSALAACSLWLARGSTVAAGAGVVALVLVPMTLWLPNAMQGALKTAAFRYAESAWLSFLNMERGSK